MRRRRTPKPKKISYELIQRTSIVGAAMYGLLEEIVEAHHKDLSQARIALAWNTSWREDVDGRVTLGKCKRASDLDRELSAFDFVILLRQSFWTDPRVTDIQRKALLDHELCHAALKHTARGEPQEDERGRPVFRTRKHDIEEFRAIVERYGLWTSDLEAFARALRLEAAGGFRPCADCRDSPGFVTVTDTDGTRRLARCPCWRRYQTLLEEAAAESPATKGASAH